MNSLIGLKQTEIKPEPTDSAAYYASCSQWLITGCEIIVLKKGIHKAGSVAMLQSCNIYSPFSCKPALGFNRTFSRFRVCYISLCVVKSDTQR